jgi:hypothetical protein
MIEKYGLRLGQILECFGSNLPQIGIPRRDFIGVYFSCFALEGGLDFLVCSVLGNF